MKYMTTAIAVREEFAHKCPGVVHHDGTARIQIVTKEDNFRLWRILTEFKEATDLPAVLNTSLNRHGMPISRDVNDDNCM